MEDSQDIEEKPATQNEDSEDSHQDAQDDIVIKRVYIRFSKNILLKRKHLEYWQFHIFYIFYKTAL